MYEGDAIEGNNDDKCWPNLQVISLSSATTGRVLGG